MGSEDSTDRRDVLSVVLSCKAFREPGLNVLWHTMYAVRPLLRFIPGMREIDGRMVRHLSNPRIDAVNDRDVMTG